VSRACCIPNNCCGVAVGWAGWTKTRGPRARVQATPSSRHFFIKWKKHTNFYRSNVTAHPTKPVYVCIASMRQEEAIFASSSCYCVLVSSVKSSLNPAQKRSILRSNNNNFLGRDLVPSPVPSPGGEDDTPSSPRTPPLSASWALRSTCLGLFSYSLYLMLNWSLATPLPVYQLRYELYVTHASELIKRMYVCEILIRYCRYSLHIVRTVVPTAV